MKTLADYETELGDLEKCILYETDYYAIKWYIYAYVECYLNIIDMELRRMIAQMN